MFKAVEAGLVRLIHKIVKIRGRLETRMQNRKYVRFG